MQFLNDIRQYVSEFGSQAGDELHRFLDFVKDKYEDMQPKDAVVAPVDGTGTTTVAAEPVAAPATDATVAEAVVADAPAVSDDAGSNDSGEAPAVEVLPDNAPAVSDEPAVVETPAEAPAAE